MRYCESDWPRFCFVVTLSAKKVDLGCVSSISFWQQAVEHNPELTKYLPVSEQKSGFGMWFLYLACGANSFPFLESGA